MIKRKFENNRLVIGGRDSSILGLIILYILGLGGAFLYIHIFITLIILIISILSFFLFRFQIILSKNKIVIKKLFLFFPYWTMKWDFERIIIKSNEFIIFENIILSKLEMWVDNDDFEPCYCLAIARNQEENYKQLGNPKDAEKIIKYILKGTEQLNVEAKYLKRNNL